MRLQQFFHYLWRSLQHPAPAPADPTETSMKSVSADTQGTEPAHGAHLMDRLALQSAIIQHLEWCVLFNDHLSVEEQQSHHLPSLPPASGSGLGLWLSQVRQGPAKDDPRVLELVAEQEHFHAIAQRALNLSRQGRMDLASTLLNTDFERSRARVLDLLRQMQKK